MSVKLHLICMKTETSFFILSPKYLFKYSLLKITLPVNNVSRI